MSRRGVFTLCDRACGVPANESQAQRYYDRTQGPLGGPHRELEAGRQCRGGDKGKAGNLKSRDNVLDLCSDVCTSTHAG